MADEFDDTPEPTEIRAVRSGTPVKRRLAAILATDAVGYSRMMAADEEGTIRTLNAHRAVIDGIIQFHDGRIVGTAGDSVLAEFASPVEAVRCAIEIQDALKTRNDSFAEDKRLLFRIGINLGDVMVKGDDLLGDGVNIAARLESLAEPGGILVSSSVYDQISGKLSLSFTDMGEQALKNIPRAVRAFRVAPGTGTPSAPVKARKQRGALPLVAGVLAVLVIAGGVAAYLGGAIGPKSESSTEAGKPSANEVAFWESVRNSTDPTELQAYLNKFPEGAFASLARARLQTIATTRAEETLKTQQAREKAEAEAAKAKAEAEAAKKQAEADKQARAKAEAETAKAKAAAPAAAPAPQAAAQPQAAPAQQTASVAQPASTTPAQGSPRFDGQWAVTQRCEQFEDSSQFVTQLRPVQIHNGQVTIQRGQSGTNGSYTVNGTVGADGALVLTGTGISGLKNYEGRQFAILLRGTMTDTGYEGTGLMGRRTCSIQLTRLAN